MLFEGQTEVSQVDKYGQEIVFWTERGAHTKTWKKERARQNGEIQTVRMDGRDRGLGSRVLGDISHHSHATKN